MAKAKSKNDVSIRMYCQGLGDCFLLSFPPKKGQTPIRVLIDCGVLQKTPAEREKMRLVAESIHKDTDGHIDLLIVTHEHWDHIAGFSHAQDVFQKIDFDHVWLSWAENLDDPDSKKLKDALGKKKKALRAALAAARGRPGLREQTFAAKQLLAELDATESVLGFFGPEDDEHTPSFAAAKPKDKKPKESTARLTLGETMDWLRGNVQAGDFRVPGERKTLPGADGVNIYILGPPKDIGLIKKMNPSGDEGYHKHRSAAMSLLGALDWLSGGGNGYLPIPFEERFKIEIDAAMADPFFREFYGFDDDPLGSGGADWRRIDDEWLVGGLGRLALQLDKVVNNTSLAVAFELADGRTLIFPGDAQAGNWKSWDKVDFKDDSGKALPTKPADLLNRAVFYKVGHHGSHNATRTKGGLFAMVSGDLVAMVPTDENFALKQPPKGSWQMPYEDLEIDLQRLTHHRILRSDRTEADFDAVGASPDVAGPRWTEFAKHVHFAKAKMLDDDGKAGDRPLFVEYTL
jgi:hypothetical protein